jgi:hypothetical protein
LRLTVHNRSAQAVRLQDAKISASPELEVIRVSHFDMTLIPAGGKRQQAFRVRILEQAAELAQLEFQISEVYVPADAGSPRN